MKIMIPVKFYPIFLGQVLILHEGNSSKDSFVLALMTPMGMKFKDVVMLILFKIWIAVKI